jgi:hypothetical protein
MAKSQRLTAIIEREGDGFVALCPELDIASQGGTVEEARANLVEALSLFCGLVGGICGSLIRSKGGWKLR